MEYIGQTDKTITDIKYTSHKLGSIENIPKAKYVFKKTLKYLKNHIKGRQLKSK